MSFLYDELTREECLAIRENDAYLFGLEESQRAITLRMLQEGLQHEFILRMTGISPEELQKLIKSIEHVEQ